MNKLLKISLITLLVVATVGVSAPSAANATVTIGSATVTGSTTLTLNAAVASDITLGGTQTTGTMNIATGGDAQAINIGTGAGAKTVGIATGAGANAINIGTGGGDTITIGVASGAGTTNLYSGTGGINITTTAATTDGIDVIASNSTADVFDIDAVSLTQGDVIDIAVPAGRTSGSAIKIVDAGGNATVTGDLIAIDVTGDPNTNSIDIDYSGTASGNAVDVTYASAAADGNALNATMGTNVSGSALNVVSVNTSGTLLNLDADPASGSTMVGLGINFGTFAVSGSMIDLAFGAQAHTGDAVRIAMGDTAVGAGAFVVTAAGGIRTDAIIDITTANTAATDAGSAVQVTSTGALGAGANVVDLDVQGAIDADSNALEIGFTSEAITGTGIEITTGTNIGGSGIELVGTGIRTGNQIDITTDETGNGPVIDINVNGIKASGGNIIDVDYVDATDIVADVINITLNDAFGAGALVVDNADGARTDAIIDITTAATATASDDAAIIQVNATGTLNGSANIIDLNVTGDAASNAIDVTYATGTATGNAIDLNMGANNVAGIAIDIASAGTGDGSVINIAHTGALANGSAAVKIESTGDYAAADGNTVEIWQKTGAGTTGNYALYVSATGANVEGLRVDDGKAVFDEQVTIATGGLTVSAGGATIAGTFAVDAGQIGATELSTTLKTGFIPLDITSAREIFTNVTTNIAANGGLLASDTTPILKRIDAATNQALKVEWAAANVDEIQFSSIPMPPDLDESSDLTVHLLANLAGTTDLTTPIDVQVFDGIADTEMGGNTGNLTSSLAEYTVTIANANIVGSPLGVLNISLTPAAHGTDALYLYSAWIEYTRK